MIISIVYMNERGRNANAFESGSDQRFKNDETLMAIDTLNVHGTALAMHALSSPLLRILVFNRAVSRIEFEWNACKRTSRLQTIHKTLIHIRQFTRRSTTLELGRLKVRPIIHCSALPWRLPHAAS